MLPHAASPEVASWGSHDLWTYSLTTGALWGSTNGGASWRSLGVSSTFQRLLTGRRWFLTGIQFASATTEFALWQRHYVVGSEAGMAVYETVDGGAQWFPVRRFDETPPAKP